MSCEDFPCCGHEMGCCPDYDESGRQLNMRCVCGAVVSIDSRSSCCESCLGMDDDCDFDEDGHPIPSERDQEQLAEDYAEDMDGDFDSGMASAGFGTDEDYGYYGGDDY